MKRFAALALFAFCGSAPAFGAMSEAQAKVYFEQALASSSGSLSGAEEVAALVSNPGKTGTSRLELWRKGPQGYDLVASAPKAGCQDCSGPTRKSNPTKVWIEAGSMHVEYQGGGGGVGYWAWRSSWGWDPALGQLRALATQRIGADESGEARHSAVNFVEGSRTQRLRQGGEVVSSSCRAAIGKTPAFSELSLPALFDGTLEPNCLAGTDSGDPLAARPAPGSGALDNLMRASKTPAAAASASKPS